MPNGGVAVPKQTLMELSAELVEGSESIIGKTNQMIELLGGQLEIHPTGKEPMKDSLASRLQDIKINLLHISYRLDESLKLVH